MATNPTLLSQPIAANGAKNVIPNTTSTAGAMSQDQGFPAETSLPLGAGGVAPSREDFNGAFNLLSGLLFYAQKGWQFEFDESQDYFAGCIVRDTLDSKLYECINDVSASTTHPSNDTTNWKLTEIDVSTFLDITLSNIDLANVEVTIDPDTGVFTCPSLGITGLMAQNGYISFGKLFGGLILQWGKQSGALTITLPIAFNTALNANIVLIGASFTGTVSDLTNTTLSITIRDPIGGSYRNTGDFYWIAVGV